MIDTTVSRLVNIEHVPGASTLYTAQCMHMADTIVGLPSIADTLRITGREESSAEQQNDYDKIVFG